MVGATVWQINFYRLLALRMFVFCICSFVTVVARVLGYGFVVFSARE